MTFAWTTTPATARTAKIATVAASPSWRDRVMSTDPIREDVMMRDQSKNTAKSTAHRAPTIALMIRTIRPDAR